MNVPPSGKQFGAGRSTQIKFMKTNQKWMAAAAGLMALAFTSCAGPAYYGENRYYGAGTYADDDGYYASTYYDAPVGPFYGAYGYSGYDPYYYGGVYVTDRGYRHHGDYRRGDHRGDYRHGNYSRGSSGDRRFATYSGGRTSTRFASGSSVRGSGSLRGTASAAGRAVAASGSARASSGTGHSGDRH